MSRVGEKAPEFSLYDTDLNLVFLKEFRGKKVVLAFYPGAFSTVCRREMCTLSEKVMEFDRLNAQILGISVDGPFANRAFKMQNGISFPLLCDFNREVTEKYGILLRNFYAIHGYSVANRAVFIVDKEGILAYVWKAKDVGEEPDYGLLVERVGKV